MAEKPFFKSRLRNKGQITVPTEIRSVLGAEEGDELLFYADEQGRVIVSRALVIPPDQAWFWSQRWQRLERQAQADIDADEVVTFDSVDEALAFLDQGADMDAED